MQAGDIVAAIDLGTSRTAYAYTVVGREHIWLGVPDSPDDDRNVSSRVLVGCLRPSLPSGEIDRHSGGARIGSCREIGDCVPSACCLSVSPPSADVPLPSALSTTTLAEKASVFVGSSRCCSLSSHNSLCAIRFFGVNIFLVRCSSSLSDCDFCCRKWFRIPTLSLAAGSHLSLSLYSTHIRHMKTSGGRAIT